MLGTVQISHVVPYNPHNNSEMGYYPHFANESPKSGDLFNLPGIKKLYLEEYRFKLKS